MGVGARELHRRTSTQLVGDGKVSDCQMGLIAADLLLANDLRAIRLVSPPPRHMVRSALGVNKISALAA